MAEKLNVKRSSYAEWERETIPQADIIAKISEISGISCDEILSENGDLTFNGEKKVAKSKQEIQSPDYQIGMLTGKLETKDEVIKAKDETIQVQKEFTALVKINLDDLSQGQKILYSWLRAGIQYHVAKMNPENKKTEAVDLDTLDKLIEGAAKIDLKSDKAASVRK